MNEAQYRKKPVVITASQWFKNGDHPEDYAKDQYGYENGELRTFTGADRKAKDWEGAVVRYYRRPDVAGESLCEQCGRTHHVHGWIDTLEQGHRVCPGDWIITGVKGEHYPCKPDVFAMTYDAAHPAPERAVTDEVPQGLMNLLIEWQNAGGCDTDGDFQYRLPRVIREAISAHSSAAPLPPTEQVTDGKDAEIKRLRAALNAMLTHMGMDEDEWNKPTFNQAREALKEVS